jgi:hypothetical protein
MAPFRALALALAAAAARADWHDGSGILLQVPPLGVAGDAASMDAAMQPIAGKVFGLPMPFSQHPGGGLVVLLLDSAVCDTWWDKGHNVPSFKAAFTAAAPVLADGSFNFPRGWDSGWPFTDATTPRFAAFVVNKEFPTSPTGLIGGVNCEGRTRAGRARDAPARSLRRRPPIRSAPLRFLRRRRDGEHADSGPALCGRVYVGLHRPQQLHGLGSAVRGRLVGAAASAA